MIVCRWCDETEPYLPQFTVDQWIENVKPLRVSDADRNNMTLAYNTVALIRPPEEKALVPKTAAERTQAIETRKTRCDEKAKPWIQDNWSLREVWKVPVDALVLNVDNRRFAAERLRAQEHLSRSLDPENCPDDELCIESLLLDKSHRVVAGKIVGSPPKDYESLKNGWERRGQETPFWIRPDGTVRNVNRRLAMIKRTQRLGGDSGLTWVDAVILDPKEIDETALLEMEQREQLTENFKVRYNDIDYLLALREAAVIHEVDWFDRNSIDGIAGKLQTTVEKSKSEVIRDLYAVKYMDLFLEDSKQPGEYHRLLRTLEMFRDIGRMMMTVEADYPDDLNDMSFLDGKHELIRNIFGFEYPIKIVVAVGKGVITMVTN